mgnify:CR=1 FL=1
MRKRFRDGVTPGSAGSGGMLVDSETFDLGQSIQAAQLKLEKKKKGAAEKVKKPDDFFKTIENTKGIYGTPFADEIAEWTLQS